MMAEAGDEWRRRIESTSVEETYEIGQRLGGVLASGDVIALVGRLGAGKTHFVKGLALGLGVEDEREVTSPTFVLVNEYEGDLCIYHIDAYRLSGGGELDSLGFDEMCRSGGVVVVEWADRASDAFGDGVLWVEIETAGETRRVFLMRTFNEALAARLDAAGLDLLD